MARFLQFVPLKIEGILPLFEMLSKEVFDDLTVSVQRIHTEDKDFQLRCGMASWGTP